MSRRAYVWRWAPQEWFETEEEWTADDLILLFVVPCEDYRGRGRGFMLDEVIEESLDPDTAIAHIRCPPVAASNLCDQLTYSKGGKKERLLRSIA